MKNVEFVNKENVDKVVYDLWATDFFKEQHKIKGSMINLLVENLKEKSFFMFDYTEDYERTHMLLWVYHLGRRTYDNKYIQDLYYFHEMYHMISFPEKRFNDFEEWKVAMFHNELEASLISEVFIYYNYPELRELTFKQTIWFDDVSKLFDFKCKKLDAEQFRYKNLPEELRHVVSRRKYLRKNSPTAFKTEDWILTFNNKDEWFKRWETTFNQVEEIRTTYENILETNPDVAKEEMERMIKSVTTHSVPFYEAAIFK